MADPWLDVPTAFDYADLATFPLWVRPVAALILVLRRRSPDGATAVYPSTAAMILKMSEDEIRRAVAWLIGWRKNEVA